MKNNSERNEVSATEQGSDWLVEVIEKQRWETAKLMFGQDNKDVYCSSDKLAQAIREEIKKRMKESGCILKGTCLFKEEYND